ncbi:MAG: phosphatase PAP2-related protein [bacterium]|nr:phosphatase PAP2-related protein [bacterium]
MTWREHLSEKNAGVVLVVTLVALGISLFSYSRFITVIEQRQGVVFYDPILHAIAPVDLTWLIFTALYGGIIGAIVLWWSDPPRILRAMRAYTILIGIRVACMALLPLDPPAGMIPLADPIVTFIAGHSSSFSRDLFFSGHTSLMCLLAFLMPTRTTRVVFGILTLFIGIAVIVQHVHYTIDVVVAPLAAWAAFSLVSASVVRSRTKGA